MAVVHAFGARLLALITAAMVTAACQASPAAPGSPLSPSTTNATQVANFAGDWQVVYHVESCIGRYCYISHINRDETMNVRLTQIGDHVTGLVGGADVDGVVAPDGTLSLRGSRPSATPVTASFELKTFEARLDAERGLTGRLDYAALMPGDLSAYSSGATGPIVSASRRPLDTSSFNGRWLGFYSAVCDAVCGIDLRDDLELSLTDAVGTLSGQVSFWPYVVTVTGRSSGNRAELTGAVPWSNGRTADVVARVERSSLGRLTGTVEMVTPAGRSVLTLLDVTQGPLPD